MMMCFVAAPVLDAAYLRVRNTDQARYIDSSQEWVVSCVFRSGREFETPS
jgi:hypothetical protein